MTVSPRWPNDDTPPSMGVGNHLAADNKSDIDLPPTLFCLPDLNRVPTHGPAASVSASVAAAQATTAVPSAASVPPVAIPQSAAIQQRTLVQPGTFTQPSTPLPATTNQSPPAHAAGLGIGEPLPAKQWGAAGSFVEKTHDEVFASRSFPELTTQRSDTPAGRSWMEVVRQHGVVVFLLLVVVATAIFTGRETDVDQSDAAVAGAVQFTEIDDGIAVEVPLPSHTHDVETGIASSPTATPAPNSNDRVSIEQTIGNAVDRKVDDSSTAIVSLEPPRSTTMPNGIKIESPDVAPKTGNDLGQVIDFASQSVDAKSVSDRVDRASDAESSMAFNAPSLEQLAGSLPDGDSVKQLESNEMPTLDGIQNNPMVPVLSKTPAGISDWSRYLPALPHATSNESQTP